MRGQASVPKLVAIVTAYNRADFVDRCLRSLLAAASAALEVRVVVMDNGSTDDTASVAAAFGEVVRVLSTPDNRHIVSVINRGFAAAYEEPGVDLVVLMNEDTEFTPGSLERLVAACKAHPDSLLTPIQMNYWTPEHIDVNAFEHVRQVRDLVEDAVLGRALRDVYPISTIIGAAIMARTEVWRSIGEFDTLFRFYGPDDDICRRARWLGYEILLVPESRLMHAHSKVSEQQTVARSGDQVRRWRFETQARYIFLLKDPGAPLWRCVLRMMGHALLTSGICTLALWPRGVIEAQIIALGCLARLPGIRRARRRHFDPARRVIPASRSPQ